MKLIMVLYGRKESAIILANLSQLLKSGISAVKAVGPPTIIMLHVALGGQNEETVFFVDNMLKRKVHFDVIGLSYYPKWHGTLDDLRGITLPGRHYDKRYYRCGIFTVSNRSE